jgi:uncharacterized membrane protein YhaH (DUF805 family)
VGFGQWYVRRGRVDRRTWWLHYALPIGLLTFLASLADASFGYDGLVTTATATTYDLGPLTTAIGLLTLVPSLSANVCRLHDRGASAWWLLLLVVPLAGPLVLFVLLAVLRGDRGPNRYGPPVAWAAPAAPPAGWPHGA